MYILRYIHTKIYIYKYMYIQKHMYMFVTCFFSYSIF